MNNVSPISDAAKKSIEENRDLMRALRHLQSSGGGGTFEGVDVVDAKIAAAEARTDTKFAQLRADLSHFATKATVWGAVGTAIISILGVLLAVLAFGGDRFDAGVGLADVRQAQVTRDERQDEAVQQINAKLDTLIASRAPANK